MAEFTVRVPFRGEYVWRGEAGGPWSAIQEVGDDNTLCAHCAERFFITEDDFEWDSVEVQDESSKRERS